MLQGKRHYSPVHVWHITHQGHKEVVGRNASFELKKEQRSYLTGAF
jgi:hypothetical protein